MKEKVLSRSRYEVIQEFTAQREEGFAHEPRTVRTGQVLWADPEYWKDQPWEGIDAVRFDWNDTKFYIERETFLRSTRKVYGNGPMNLDELKSEAKKRGYTRIKRDGDNAPWVELEAWNGFWAGTAGIPTMSVQVDYYLEGNRVIVRKALDDQEYGYTLA